jgi:hypothetical protein
MIAATGVLEPRTRYGVIEGLLMLVTACSPSRFWAVTTSGAVLPSEPGAPFAHSGTLACCAKPAPVASPSTAAKPQTARSLSALVPTIPFTRIAAPRTQLYRRAQAADQPPAFTNHEPLPTNHCFLYSWNSSGNCAFSAATLGTSHTWIYGLSGFFSA